MLDKQFLWPYHSKAAEGSGPPGDVSGRSASGRSASGRSASGRSASGRSASGRSAALSGQHGNFQFPNAATDALQGAALVPVRNQQTFIKHHCGERIAGCGPRGRPHPPDIIKHPL